MKRLIVSLMLMAVFATVNALAQDRPNIVLIIADDMGAEDCGPYGNKGVRTPNLDRLAREGMRMDSAFLTCSSCSPSRASILTGRYPHETGAEQLHWPLPGGQPGFTEKLRAAGYWNAAAGKWHLGNAAKAKFDLVAEKSAPIPKDADPATKARLQREARSGCTEWVATLQARPKEKPFFLWLAAFDPHRDYDPETIARPHATNEVTVPPYLPDTTEVREDFARYYDEITRLDGYVGDVLKELERQGVARNTLVMFISDNGRAFPRCKTTVYDSGVRTPMLVRWPGKIKPGTTSASLVSSVDIAPTFLSVAGVKNTPFRGKDFSNLFSNPRSSIREYVFAEHNWHDYEARSRAVRSAHFKYIRHDYVDLPGTPPADAVRSPTFQEMRRLRDEGNLPSEQLVCFVKPRPREELFDLRNDPHEMKNLALDDRHAATLKQMRSVLDKWAVETNDRVPAERTPDAADRELGTRLPGFVGYSRNPQPDRKFQDKFKLP